MSHTKHPSNSLRIHHEQNKKSILSSHLRHTCAKNRYISVRFLKLESKDKRSTVNLDIGYQVSPVESMYRAVASLEKRPVKYCMALFTLPTLIYYLGNNLQC